MCKTGIELFWVDGLLISVLLQVFMVTDGYGSISCIQMQLLHFIISTLE